MSTPPPPTLNLEKEKETSWNLAIKYLGGVGGGVNRKTPFVGFRWHSTTEKFHFWHQLLIVGVTPTTPGSTLVPSTTTPGGLTL